MSVLRALVAGLAVFAAASALGCAADDGAGTGAATADDEATAASEDELLPSSGGVSCSGAFVYLVGGYPSPYGKFRATCSSSAVLTWRAYPQRYNATLHTWSQYPAIDSGSVVASPTGYAWVIGPEWWNVPRGTLRIRVLLSTGNSIYSSAFAF